MTNLSKIDVDGVGAVLFSQSQRARRVIITVSASRGVRVSVPPWSSFQKALEFVSSKKTWISKQLAKIEQDKKLRKASAGNYPTIDIPEAKKRLAERLRRVAKEHGFTYNRVTIRNQKTRWGSCSHKNNISLNIKLLRLPEELIDYVMLHELVHTRVHNHSGRFWAELGKYVENPRLAAKRLRKSGYELI